MVALGKVHCKDTEVDVNTAGDIVPSLNFSLFRCLHVSLLRPHTMKQIIFPLSVHCPFVVGYCCSPSSLLVRVGK